jgi:nucleoside-diphosphate-sugar epimerase
VRTLILGGTRFIGRALTLRLQTEGHEVHLVTLTKAHAAFAPWAIVHPGDRREQSALAAATGHFDVVYDFLGFDAAEARVAVDSLAGRCNRFVHLSTGSVYWIAEARRCPWIEEDGTALPLRDRETCDKAEFDYGVAKRECEEVYRTAAKQGGFPVVFVRAPVVSGPNDHRRRDQFWVRRILEGRPCILPDGGTNVFNHVYVDDLVEVLLRLASTPVAPGEAFNAADRVFTTLREYIERFADALGRKADLVAVPRAAIAAAALDDRSFFFADTKSHVLDNRKASAALDMRFKTPDEWIPPTAAWCKAMDFDAAELPRLAVEAGLAKTAS